MINPEASIRVNVDVTNPGQFFACCGLLELADRLWPGAEGWFEHGQFNIAAPVREKDHLVALIEHLHDAFLTTDDREADHKTCPLKLTGPFKLRLDWWLDKTTGGDRLKTWAGRQSVSTMAPAMKNALNSTSVNSDMFNFGLVVKDPTDPKKPVEPFYFDARRFAHGLDAGFSLDVQEAETVAHPAAEFFCLIGLQRFRPSIEGRAFTYRIWFAPPPALVASAAGCGLAYSGIGYRFRTRFRSADRKDYKALTFATPIGENL
jgi:hypothetical protein